MKRVTVELERYVPASEVFHLAAKEPGCAFLDSSLVNELGRWSILGLRPYKTLVKEQDGSFTEDDVARPDTDFETRLGEFLRLNRDENETELPIVSGAIGYFSYDYGREHMGVPSAEQDVEPIPQARVVFYDLLLIEDCHEKRVWLSACGQTEDALELLAHFRRDIERGMEEGFPALPDAHATKPITVRPNFEKEEYKAAVDRMIRYIIEGDIYIANMTQRLDVMSDSRSLSICARTIPRPSVVILTAAITRSSAPRRSASCACATAWWKHVPSRARASAERRRKKTRRCAGSSSCRKRTRASF